MTETPDESLIEKAAGLIFSSRRVAVLTGAGISAESGIPTFRGSGGLWKQYKAHDLATLEAFAKHPEVVWEWYNWRREVIASKKPNGGHEALACLEKLKKTTLITQNVDGLHQKAGSNGMLELHGSVWRLRCSQCEYERRTIQFLYPFLPNVPIVKASSAPLWSGSGNP